ncbi:murein L,D-transpeptidase [Bartonella krasnovii]|uniref:Murein L,D-transpeptidase n=1 Tax=Bartonella krasnovii TaxID=2267275 RepID=A0A5B9D3L8_9HYPH|nr:murein L,D-transpeptidase family protein [Bartonella krasnovii]QEE12960.1 murein L,D-transpeptidase [Bartonella krasnovii]UNF42142.1 murein L,D-transpeptidase [Bartonella krasnovii]UNF51994.1 murein L,D-transpeptidase [Bartonella krasnovii]UNF53648.1 murein L,D-transpeptidase [Bartonella krasnovii]UNF55347.1 murein L,D-transpeptidase [Bartonella krasnovii]
MTFNRFLALCVLCVMGILTACKGRLPASIRAKVEQPLPQEIQNRMALYDIDPYAPIVMRFFKEENLAEVWKQSRSGPFILVARYGICKWSGKLGPKYKEGDLQTPEGFYTITAKQMNPYSKYYLSFNIGFPNLYDQENGRTGSNLMVHGSCFSAGCYSMSDKNMAQIYAFARDAFKGGQRAFQLQAFPFRMTKDNMLRHSNDPHYSFWVMLKKGYDFFEENRQPPVVEVYEKRYIFNRDIDKTSVSLMK